MTDRASSPSLAPRVSVNCSCGPGLCRACKGVRYYDANRDAHRARVKRYYMRTKDAKHVKRVESTYGLTANQYRKLLAFQDHRCALCGVHEAVLPQRICIDHRHLDGVVRGGLCRSCNVSVGSAEKHKTGAFSY